jgi:hypothetical protein
MASAVFVNCTASGAPFRRSARDPETGEVIAKIEFPPGVPVLVDGFTREVFAGELQHSTAFRKAEVPPACWPAMLQEYADERRDAEIERLRGIVGAMRARLSECGVGFEECERLIADTIE